MTKENANSKNITLRPAQPADADRASRLIFDTFPKLATYCIGLGDPHRAKAILSEIFTLKGHRLSYQYTEMASQGESVVGMFIAYPGKELTRLGWRLARYLLSQYNFAGKLKLIRRGLPLVFIQEAAVDEYLLSNLAVKKGQRGRGIGTQILSAVEEKARQASYTKLALMVEIDNRDARRFYEHYGYAIKAIHLEPNHRVRHLGLGYQRMVKTLTQ